jgi:hypothetical protein
MDAFSKKLFSRESNKTTASSLSFYISDLKVAYTVLLLS